jgi:hypothetical protein
MNMNRRLLLLLSTLLISATFVHAQPTNKPSPFGKEQIVKFMAELTNGMPERVASRLLAEQGLKFNYISESAERQTRTYHYAFTNGTMRLVMKPMQKTPRQEWFAASRTNGFLRAAELNGVALRLPTAGSHMTNAPAEKVTSPPAAPQASAPSPPATSPTSAPPPKP